MEDAREFLQRELAALPPGQTHRERLGTVMFALEDAGDGGVRCGCLDDRGEIR
jgi:hypothetical protein